MSNQLLQIINFTGLAFDMALSLLVVGRDARSKGLPWSEVVAWTVVSTVTFPFGLGLYFLWRPERHTFETDRAG